MIDVKKKKSLSSAIIVLALLIIYMAFILKITVFRGPNFAYRSVNLVPFLTIAEYIRFILSLSGKWLAGIINISGNLAVFSPLGYMTALLFPKMRKWKRILIFAASFSILIEILQYILACGSSDIDDVILNSLGGVLGYGAYVFMSTRLNPKRCAFSISCLVIAFLCLGSVGFKILDNQRFLLNAPAGKMAYATQTVPASRSADVSQTLLDTAWNLILVNKDNPIPGNYEMELAVFLNKESVDKRIWPALQEMFDAAREDGVYPVVVSGYRTHKKQQSIVNNLVAEYRSAGYSSAQAKTMAGKMVATPGTSEHEIGIAVDINADARYSTDVEVYEWLSRNSYLFGFIYRYPADKTGITGVSNEPWHFRYVGADAAAEIYSQGICLEEYLAGKASE